MLLFSTILQGLQPWFNFSGFLNQPTELPSHVFLPFYNCSPVDIIFLLTKVKSLSQETAFSKEKEYLVEVSQL